MFSKLAQVQKSTADRKIEKLQARVTRLTEKQKTLTKKKKEPNIADLKKSVQRLVNTYVRERDKDLPCISCGKWSDKYDAGHYINQGSSGFLRYNLDNLHKQCSFQCNHNLSGNKIEYRIALVKKIGVERVEWLEAHRKDVKKWTREELETLKKGLK
jgi:hypothetical protein